MELNYNTLEDVMVRTSKLPRTEKEVLNAISRWCNKTHPKVKVAKEKTEKLIEGTGEKKLIDATVIGHYEKRRPAGGKICLLAELEFEEHEASYSILNDMTEITFLLRKLGYWRNDIAQFWIKVDKDGTPFMINFRYIKENECKLVEMGRSGRWQKKGQITRIKAAERKSKKDPWPDYVIIGWDSIYKELDRIITLGKF